MNIEKPDPSSFLVAIQLNDAEKERVANVTVEMYRVLVAESRLHKLPSAMVFLAAINLILLLEQNSREEPDLRPVDVRRTLLLSLMEAWNMNPMQFAIDAAGLNPERSYAGGYHHSTLTRNPK